MGRRGPRPTPLTQLAARGSWRGKPGAAPAPSPASEAPACPPWLSEAARQIWAALCDELARMGTLAGTDARTMARYCDAYARWQTCAQWLSQYGDVRVDAGEVKPWPQVKIYNALSSTLLRLEQEFGLTPSSRSRISTAAAPPPRTAPTPTAGVPTLRIAQ